MYLILLCFGTLFGLGAFFLLAGLLRLPTSASTKAVLTVTNRGKAKKNSMNAILFDMAAKAAPLVRLDAYKRRKLEAQLKSAEIQMSPETYVAAAWVKAGLIGLLVIRPADFPYSGAGDPLSGGGCFFQGAETGG